jgi:flagellar motor switch/type III secretory pathway protein FliN
MGGRVKPDDLEADPTSGASSDEPGSSLGPLAPLPRLSHREALFAARLARLAEDGGIRPALAWLAGPLGAEVQVGVPEVLWKASALRRGGSIAQLERPRVATRVGLGLETALAHGVVDGLLGFQRPAEESRLQISPVEWGVLTMVVAETLRRLSGSPGSLGQWDLLLDRVGPDPFDTSDLGRLVTLRWPVRIGATEGSLRLWITESLARRWLAAGPRPPERPLDDVAVHFPELEGVWRVEAGPIAVEGGVASLHVGRVFPLLAAGLSGEPENPAGIVTLSFQTSDRDGRYVIPGELEPHSRGERVRATGTIQHLPTPREGLPMSPSTSTSPADLPVTLVVELGRVNLTLARLAEFRPGDVLPLGRHPREPIELTSGGRLVARGELVQVDEELGLRLTNVLI